MPAGPIDGRKIRAWFMREAKKTSQPLKERASILPLGQYEDGSVGLAWPGLLAAPAEGMANFGRYGYDTPEAIRDNAASAFDVAGGAVTGGLGLGLAGGLADNSVGIFGGRLAKTADQNALARAEKLAAEGAPREQIWNDTGWFQGVDGKWRFEIDDSGATFRDGWDKAGPNTAQPIESALNHDQLFKAYPEMGAADSYLGLGKFEGYSDGKSVAAYGPTSDDAMSILMHELQHNAQATEGFFDRTPIGYTPRSVSALARMAAEDIKLPALQEPQRYEALPFWQKIFANRKGMEKGYREYLDELTQRYDHYSMEGHRRGASEEEARAVQARLNLSADQRRERPPWLDYLVPEAEQIYANAPTGAAIPLAGEAQNDTDPAETSRRLMIKQLMDY